MKIVWSKKAQEVLLRVEAYIAEESPASAAQVVSSILRCVECLREFPEMGDEGRVEGTRELVVNYSPYLVVYRIRNEWIEILTLLHMRQRFPA